jgi:drug/metabolite transporter (DMT)-like permease
MDYLALLGGASFALNNAMLRKLAFLPESDRMGAMFGGGTCITALAAAALLPSGLVSLPADTSWWPFALGLALCLLFSNLSLQYGAARLPANTTALVMLSEIVFATASSVMMGASELNVRKIAGGLLIVFAAILATMQDANKESA